MLAFQVVLSLCRLFGQPVWCYFRSTASLPCLENTILLQVSWFQVLIISPSFLPWLSWKLDVKIVLLIYLLNYLWMQMSVHLFMCTCSTWKRRFCAYWERRWKWVPWRKIDRQNKSCFLHSLMDFKKECKVNRLSKIRDSRHILTNYSSRQYMCNKCIIYVNVCVCVFLFLNAKNC